MDNQIDFISSTVLLGINLSDNIFNKHISNTVRNFYCRSNELLFDFSTICYDLKSRLMSTYCMDLCASSLCNFRKHDDVEELYVAWRKVIRRLWKLPNTNHCNLLHTINNCLPIDVILEKRCAKFVWSCINSKNNIVKSISTSATSNPFSDFADNYKYITYKYKIPVRAWRLPICHIFKLFDVYIENHVEHSHYGYMIRELCLQRNCESFILTSTELSMLIEYLCTI